MPNYKLRHGSVQEAFQQSRAKIQIFGGSYANGKTTGGVVKGLRCALDYPGSNGLMCRATYPKLNGSVRKIFNKWCPKPWIEKYPSDKDNTYYLKNGTVVDFRYISQKGKNTEDGTTTSNVLGATYDWIFLDQIEDPEITHKDFLDLAGRLRGDTPYNPGRGVEEDPSMPSTGPRFFMISCNPTANWFYKLVVHPYLLFKEKGIRTENLLVDSETGEPIIELFESDIYANKDNLEKDFIVSLESMYKGQMRSRYLKGEWAAFEGLVHPTYSLERHSLTRQRALDHLDDCLRRHVRVKVVEGYDFGLTNPTCYMLGFVDDFGRLIILDGFYQKDFDYTDHPGAIREIRHRYIGRLNVSGPINADPAIFRKQVIAGRKNTGDTLAKLLKELGIQTKPATNNVLSGIAKVNAYLNGLEQIPNLLNGEMKGPLLYVVDDLSWFGDEITSYYWKKNPFGMNEDEPQDRNDHAMNTLKYMLAFLPKPSEIIVPANVLPPGWMRWHEMEVSDFQRVTHTRR